MICDLFVSSFVDMAFLGNAGVGDCGVPQNYVPFSNGRSIGNGFLRLTLVVKVIAQGNTLSNEFSPTVVEIFHGRKNWEGGGVARVLKSAGGHCRSDG